MFDSFYPFLDFGQCWTLQGVWKNKLLLLRIFLSFFVHVVCFFLGNSVILLCIRVILSSFCCLVSEYISYISAVLFYVCVSLQENTIAYWRKFVGEYYAPRAKKRWCLSLYNNVGQHALGVFPQAAMVGHCIFSTWPTTWFFCWVKFLYYFLLL